MTANDSQDSLPNILPSSIDTAAERFRANADAMRALLAEFEAEQAIIREGGGAKAIEAQHKKNRLTARERLELLLDQGTEFTRAGLYAAHGMYEEYGGAPAAGTVTGLGRVAGRL